MDPTDPSRDIQGRELRVYSLHRFLSLKLWCAFEFFKGLKAEGAGSGGRGGSGVWCGGSGGRGVGGGGGKWD